MSVGIIAEYNPFHNGHLYHLNKIKKMFPNEEIVLVMSGNFSERGEPSIIDKFKKTEIALKLGIDIVVELPFAFATEAADYFAKGSIKLLEELQVDKLVFGSETDNIEIINKLVDAQLYNNDFDILAKTYMKMGQNYPTALSLALEDLTKEKLILPNDLLGISYVKEIKKNNYNIKPLCIKRENNYHDKTLDKKLVSATSIRDALNNNIDISSKVPKEVLPYLNDLHFEDDYFKFLKFKIMLEDNIDIYQTVDEGLGSKIKKEIISSTSYDDLIKKVKSKRYTHNKINRMLTHILCNFTKEDKKKMSEIEYIRILGFNDKGRIYLNKIKKDTTFPIITNFSKIKNKMIDLEFTSSCVYASTLNEEKKKELIELEYKHHPYYKKEG